MIVSKTLELYTKGNIYKGAKIFILGNTVKNGSNSIGVLKNSEKDSILKLLKRNRNITVSSSWIDYIKYVSESCLRELNRTNYYKYEDRGWELEDDGDKYRVSIFLDNYDIEQFAYVNISKDSIGDVELEQLKRICD